MRPNKAAGWRKRCGCWPIIISSARSFMAQVAYPFFLVHMALVIFPTQLLPQLVWEGRVLQFLQQKMMVFVPLYAAVFLLVFASQGRHGETWRALIQLFIRPSPTLGRAK